LNGWHYYVVKTKGRASSSNILAACKAKGLLTPCDLPSYNDGKCVTTASDGHLSYAYQSGPGWRTKTFDLAEGKYFYCGKANGDLSRRYATGPRWSEGSDSEWNIETLCVDWPEASQAKVDWNGWTFVPTNVTGEMTSANIYATCKAAGLETPCESSDYSDGQCVTVFSGNLSNTPSHSGLNVTDNKCFYAGTQQNGMSLCSTGNATVAAHRWATPDNENGQTLCVTGNALKQKPQNWNGWWWVPTDFKGAANSANILAACASAGLQTPCDHSSYNDGKCISIGNFYMSQPRNDGFYLNHNKFFYCGSANGVESRYNTGANL
jgi:hypothetical protein